MATLVSIKQRIDQLGSGEFQILCDAYLSRKGYQNIVSLGTKAGSHKTTKGTPDTYFYTDDGKYVFVEYTTQKDDLVGKIRADINKCLDEDNTGIALSSISEIVYCHTSSNLSPRSSASLRKLCKDHGILLTLIGIDALADDLQNYPAIVKKHLQLEIDTEQILSIEDFISAYNSNALAASLNTQFAFREEELKKIDEAFETKDVVILSGTAGTGKTRLALEYARSRIAKNHDTTFFVRNHSLPIFDDLKFYFDTPRHYFLVIDDANQLSELKLVVELANKKQDGYYFKILITVRNYALQIVRERISEIARYKEIQINALTDNEIESIVKNTYGIVNPKYLERIARISEGNARIAILCGKIAVETDRLDSISDVSQLYEEYYGPVFFTAGLDATVPLQISAAVIAFLGSIHFDHIEPVLPLLMKKGIDVDSFIREVYKLHELEIVDIYHDKACSISDQCFSNYILKRVFFDQKSLGLSEMIEACFESFRERTIQSINTLIGVFCGDSLRAFVSDEIKAAWKGHQSKTDSKYWEWVESFYPVDLVGTLLYN